MPRRWSAFLLGVLVPRVLLVAGVVSAAPDGVELLTADERGVSFILHAPDGPLSIVERPDEPPALEILGLASVEAPNGWLMPARSVWVAIPPGSEVIARSTALDSKPLAIDRPGSFGIAVEGLPRSSVEVSSPSWLRNQRVVAVTWTPVVWGRDGPVRERSVRIDLLFEGGESGTQLPASGDRWEGIYRDLLVNYETARSWRRQAVQRLRAPQGDTFGTTSNPWLRIDVLRHALYEVTGTDLQAAGIDLSAIVPEELALFTGSGLSVPERVPVTDLPEWLHEVAIEVEDDDGTFDPQDRILFRGLGPDGWFSDYAVPDGLYERFRTDEFSNVNTYWLSWGEFEGQRRRWEDVDGGDVPPNPRTTAPHRVHFEKNRFWDPRPWEVLFDMEGQDPDSLPFWEKWYWDEIIASRNASPRSVRFKIDDPDPEAAARLVLRMWGASHSARTDPPDHAIELGLGGSQIASGSWDDYGRIDLVAEGLTLSTEEQELSLLAPYSVDTTGLHIDRSYLAWFEVEYPRQLVFAEDSLAFRVPASSEREGFAVGGIVDTSSVVVLDVTDPLAVLRIVPRFEAEGSLWRLLFGVDPDPDRERQILVLDRDGAESPSIIRDEPPSGGYLRERTDPIDYILVAHSSAWNAGERLAAWRELHGPDGEGLRVALVDIQDIYDEFSAGRCDPTAIRNFLQDAASRWNGGDPQNGPSYVCLLGDASYDFRNRRGQRGDLIVPTYEGYYVPNLTRTVYSPQFGSDDYYVLFDEPPDPTLDMVIGRLPADNPGSAESVVDKVIAYESTPAQLDHWRQRFTLVADDICQGLNYDGLFFRHMTQTEELADEILPDALERDRIYLYEFGSECVFDRKPDAAAALLSSIEQGTLVVNFTGHGSEEQLADERVLETEGVAGMTNGDRLFFFLTASCSVGKFDFAGEGLGETLVRHPNGGAIGIFSATGVAYSGSNATLNREFFKAVFPNRDANNSVGFGTAAVIAKQNVPQSYVVGNRRYPLLGEPVVRIVAPRQRVSLQLEGTSPDGASSADTIYRGAPIRITGEIQDQLGHQQTDFRGRVDLILYDSEIVRHEAYQGSVAGYNLTGAPIFRGEASVDDGRFETLLLAPAALRTGERGKALLYAVALAEDGAAAIGSRVGIDVPAVPPPASSDQEGPQITLEVEGDPEQLSIDAPWTATLVDSSGINITQLVASRSVLLRIEEEARLVHVEDLASHLRFPESFQVGQLEFDLPNGLEAGRRYRLTLEASDNLDHRASGSQEFVLAGVGQERLAIDRLYNVPNPMERGTTFFLEIGQAAAVTIRIFTANGKMIRELDGGTISAAQAAGTGIEWDGTDEEGDRLANGVYFYKVSVRGEDGQRADRIERLAVLR